MAWTTVRRGVTVGVIVLATLGALLLVAPPKASAAPRVFPSAETAMIRSINKARAASGLAPLRRNLQLVRHARQWARVMARQRAVSHRPNLAVVVDGDYRRLAENVGMTSYGTTMAAKVAELHRAFMASPGHRANVVGRFNLVGVGVTRTADGALWMTVNFLQGPRRGFPLYRDMAGRRGERAVNRLFVRGGLQGCHGGRFCPRADATRRQMALMLDRASRTSQASNYVNAACGSLSSCRRWKVSKVDLAVAVARAAGLAPAGGRRYSDVSAEKSGAVNAVVRAGIMAPCSRTRFCSRATINRVRLARVAIRAWR